MSCVLTLVMATNCRKACAQKREAGVSKIGIKVCFSILSRIWKREAGLLLLKRGVTLQFSRELKRKDTDNLLQVCFGKSAGTLTENGDIMSKNGDLVEA